MQISTLCLFKNEHRQNTEALKMEFPAETFKSDYERVISQGRISQNRELGAEPREDLRFAVLELLVLAWCWEGAFERQTHLDIEK